MSKQLQKLELTWIGKEKLPRLEPRALVEHHAPILQMKSSEY